MNESPSRTTLKGWKSIADYFGRDASTVMRWAAHRGLPVHRMPGEGRSSVYALPAELAAWLATAASPGGDVPAHPDPGPAPDATPAVLAPPRPLRDGIGPVARPVWRMGLIGAAAAAIVVTVAIVAPHGPARPAPHPAFHDAEIERAYLAATYDLDLRTPESLARARAEFGAIIARDPTAAPAYARLGEVYLLLREYSAFPAAEAYRKAAAAARAAIALQPELLAAHRVLAFVAFWGEHDITTARAEFARARALDPHDAQTWHWYATALSANGEQAAALDAIEQARRLAPDSTAIAADDGLITYTAGRTEEGLAMLQRIAAASPGHMSAHQYLGDIALIRGDGATYLTEAATACRLRGDVAGEAALAADRAAFARGGQPALLESLAARLRRQVTATNGHFALAAVLALQGLSDEAMAALHQSAAANESEMASLPGNLAFRSLAANHEFEVMVAHESLAAS